MYAMASQALRLPFLPVNKTLLSSLPPRRRQVPHLRHGRLASEVIRCSSAIQAPWEPPLRRSADYQPTLWHDSFIQTLTSDYMTEAHAAKLEKLKGRVKRIIGGTAGMGEMLRLLDALRRLGVACHFEQEMELVLHGTSTNAEDVRREVDGDLLRTALLFRLLREHGFEVSQDVFDGFRDEHGSFRESLREDPEGMLSLYEASFLALEGEKVLDEARAFATAGLGELILGGRADAQLKETVEYALEMPLHWRVPRVYTRWFIDVCEREGKVTPLLLDLAKLDFNMVQSQHRRDLRAMSRSSIRIIADLPESVPATDLGLLPPVSTSIAGCSSPEGGSVPQRPTFSRRDFGRTFRRQADIRPSDPRPRTFDRVSAFVAFRIPVGPLHRSDPTPDPKLRIPVSESGRDNFGYITIRGG